LDPGEHDERDCDQDRDAGALSLLSPLLLLLLPNRMPP
jgi:hypothetical protein